jgi:mRNA-degrading endonuclease toxin of MazEF toxin-antitoxin module
VDDTVLVVPLSTSIHKTIYPAHVLLIAGETGVREDSIAGVEDITVVRKSAWSDPRSQLRAVSNRRICELADKVKFAMGC